VRPEAVLRFFPASMAVSGLMLCLEGRLYLFGMLDFVAALLLAVWLDLAPLLFGLWNSAVLVWMGWYLRRRAREYGETSPAQQVGP
jgi:hypothetical protein